VIEYRPRLAPTLVVSAIFGVTGAILVWLGLILGPEDRAAMEGVERLLFTVIPIGLFSWIMAAVFFALCIRVAFRFAQAAPTMAVSGEGLTPPAGKLVLWSKVRSVEVITGDILVIEVESETDRPAPRGGRSWLSRLRHRRDARRITLSSADLGDAPTAVAAELRKRMADASGLPAGT
jgi:hypothetical protein